MMIRLCGFAKRVPNKINDTPIAQENCNVRGRNEMGMTNEQDLELGETTPLMNNVHYHLLKFSSKLELKARKLRFIIFSQIVPVCMLLRTFQLP